MNPYVSDCGCDWPQIDFIHCQLAAARGCLKVVTTPPL